MATRQLMGTTIDLPSLANEPVVPAFDELSKKAARLLEFAVTHGRVEQKGDGSHFSTLVRLGLIEGSGAVTALGRACYKDR